MEKVGVAGYEKVAVDGARSEAAAVGAPTDGGEDCGDAEVSEGAFEALVVAIDGVAPAQRQLRRVVALCRFVEHFKLRFCFR